MVSKSLTDRHVEWIPARAGMTTRVTGTAAFPFSAIGANQPIACVTAMPGAPSPAPVISASAKA